MDGWITDDFEMLKKELDQAKKDPAKDEDTKNKEEDNDGV